MAGTTEIAAGTEFRSDSGEDSIDERIFDGDDHA